MDHKAPSSVANAAARQLRVEVKRQHLAEHASREVLIKPKVLWESLVKHRARKRKQTAAERSGLDVERQLVLHDEEDDDDDDGELRLNYEGFRQVAEELILDRIDATRELRGRPKMTEEEAEQQYFANPLLSPRTFLAFPVDDDDTVDIVALFTYVAKKLLLYNLRAKLELHGSIPPPALRDRSEDATRRVVPTSRHSPWSNGLCAPDVESFVAELLPNLRVIRDMPKFLLPYYLCHAAQKFMFMLDHKNLNVVSIEALMKSEVFSELLRVYEADEDDAVVHFRAGATVQIPQARALRAAAEQRGEPAPRNEDIDDDLYTDAIVMTVREPAEDASPSSALYTVAVVGDLEVDGRAGAGEQQGDTMGSSLVVTLPRECICWTQSTTETLPTDVAALDNWFSLPIMHRVYKTFCDLDLDGDGLLTQEEFSRYNNGSFVPLVVSRVFELFVKREPANAAEAVQQQETPAPQDDSGLSPLNVPQSSTADESTLSESEVSPSRRAPKRMDYKTFLRFVIATEHPLAEPSVQYMWRILDLQDTGSYIDLNILRVFCKEISTALGESQLMVITADSILSELTDMINPSDHEVISREDLKRSGQAGTVLPVLMDYRNFYAYDCREQLAATDTNAELP